MTTLTELTARLRELASKATPGPYVHFPGQRGIYAECDSEDFGGTHLAIATAAKGNRMYPGCVSPVANGDYLTALDPQTITRLLDALAAAQAVVDATHNYHDRSDRPLDDAKELNDALAAYDRAAGNGGTG